MKIRLLAFESCPNAREARHRLAEALEAEGLPARWEEIDVPDVEAAGREGFLGSPSIQIDGQDMEAARRGEKPCWSCRTYRDAQGNVSGAPPVEMIRSALHQGGAERESPRGRSGIWRFFTALPGGAAALLPIGVCPACWPAYVGFLSAAGLGFLLQSKYLLPLTAGFLAVALGALGYGARRRRGYGPLILGSLAAILVMSARFVPSLEPAVYPGVGLLLAASIWNAWPRRATGATACPSCVPTGQSDTSEHTTD